jgi:UbiD family decarboxylase
VPALTSFRELIGALKRDGVLRSVSRAVDPRYELIAVMRAVQKAGNEPLLFTNVAGSPARSPPTFSAAAMCWRWRSGSSRKRCCHRLSCRRRHNSTR